MLEWLLTADLTRKPVAKCDNKTSAHYVEQWQGTKVIIKAQHSLKPPHCTCLDHDKHYQGRFTQQNATRFREILGEH